MKNKNELDQNKAKAATLAIVLLMSFLAIAVILLSNASEENKKLLESMKLMDTNQTTEIEKAKKKAYTKGVSDGIEKTKLEMQKLSDKPFKPKLDESLAQASVSLALTVYGESRSEMPEHRETIAWAIINRVLDEREDSIYRNTISAVVASKDQYDGIKPYLGVVSKVVWGDWLDYVPKSARDVNTDDGKSWLEIVSMVKEILDGKRSRKTVATHFYSPSADSDGRFPDWIRYLKPIGVAGKHLLYVDYAVIDGKFVHFNKENPYNPKIHG